jgi:hypothetical protein
MVRLPAVTANSPKHGQPGQTSGENGVKTPCMWAVNTPVRKRSRKKETRGEGKVKGPYMNHEAVWGGDLTRKKWVGCMLASADGNGQTGGGPTARTRSIESPLTIQRYSAGIAASQLEHQFG